MSRKHFIAAAAQVKAIGSADPAGAKFLGEQFADLFASFNPNFDRGRFMFACGL